MTTPSTELTQAGNPMAFRDFLLKSPEMFITLGERTGMVSHIASFWRYRFPKGRPLKVELDELFDILQDFHQGLGEDETKSQARPRSATSALMDPASSEAIGKAVWRAEPSTRSSDRSLAARSCSTNGLRRMPSSPAAARASVSA